MAAPEKRLPGQSNAQYEYEGRRDPNADFLGTHSIQGGGDPTWMIRAWHAVFAWFDRRKGRS
ncbi:hypothetical protein GCM10007977_088350 [Dactylosporangium sucinum]|uniref:Uncharacterized protein n=1 Tax=Dactylosporangium sucinum TaxID=1424081 RepID=A0A917UCF6_9ACTN|nr:hypothetical protein GCM10007977_088350 [Dactylosporangium sucinum]